MSWLLIIGGVAGGLGLLAASVAIVGSRLPPSHVASGEVLVPGTPAAVWKVITDVEAFSTWRKDVSRAERLPDRSGQRTWIEHGSDRPITFTVDRAEPPHLLVVRIADRDLPFGGTWSYEITEASGGTRVRITEHGEIYNPVFRFMARFVFGYQGTIKTYLASLERRFAEGAQQG